MSTIIRPELSESNKYYVNKHRYYELKHFCMQYPDFKKSNLESYISLIEEACKRTDPIIGRYILEAVINGYSYDIIRARRNVPCCKDIYYDLYRRFFWILDAMRR